MTAAGVLVVLAVAVGAGTYWFRPALVEDIYRRWTRLRSVLFRVFGLLVAWVLISSGSTPFVIAGFLSLLLGTWYVFVEDPLASLRDRLPF